MKIFLDTANVDEIKEGVALGVVDGVTTNPSLIAKEKRPFRPLVEEICKIVPGDVSLEVVATAFEDMVKEGEQLAQVAPNAVVKVPLTQDGLKAVKYLSGKGIRVLRYYVEATKGARVVVTCSKKGCRRTVTKGKGPKRVRISRLSNRRLKPGTRITVTVSMPGRLTTTVVDRVRNGRRVSGRRHCYTPGIKAAVTC